MDGKLHFSSTGGFSCAVNELFLGPVKLAKTKITRSENTHRLLRFLL